MELAVYCNPIWFLDCLYIGHCNRYHVFLNLSTIFIIRESDMMLYHYFDSTIGPFRNLSDLPDEEADRVILQFRQQKRVSKETLYLTQ